MHADAFEPGDRVLIVDDVLATGGTAAAACKLVEQAGGKVAGLAFVIELAFLDGAVQAGGLRALRQPAEVLAPCTVLAGVGGHFPGGIVGDRLGHATRLGGPHEREDAADEEPERRSSSRRRARRGRSAKPCEDRSALAPRERTPLGRAAGRCSPGCAPCWPVCPGSTIGVPIPERLQPLVVDPEARLAAGRHQGRRCGRTRSPTAAHAGAEAQVRASPTSSTRSGSRSSSRSWAWTPPTIVAALLHDVVEDTEMIRRRHRRGVRRRGRGAGRRRHQAGPHQGRRPRRSSRPRACARCCIAMASDARVLLIKLADRLHNMMTIHHLPRRQAGANAEETLCDLRAAGAPPRHAELQVAAGGPGLPTLQPKRYDEIKSMVAERQPERDRYLERVVGRGRGAPARRQDPRRDHRPPEALLLDLREDGRARQREFDEIFDLVGLRVHRGVGQGLLRRAGHAALDVASHPGALQGLHRDAQVQPLPVAAHLGGGARGQADRGADPHQRDAPHRRVRHRRALEVQGDAHRPASSRTRREAQWLSQMLDMQSADHATPASSCATCAWTSTPTRSSSSRPSGDIMALPRGSTPVDFAYAVHTEVGHRTDRRAGQRAAGRAGVRAAQRRQGRDPDLEGLRRGARRATGWSSSGRRARARRSRAWFTP